MNEEFIAAVNKNSRSRCSKVTARDRYQSHAVFTLVAYARFRKSYRSSYFSLRAFTHSQIINER